MTATDPRPALAAMPARSRRPRTRRRDTPGEPEAVSGYDGSRDTPEIRAWDERQKRRKEASSARYLEAAGRRGT